MAVPVPPAANPGAVMIDKSTQAGQPGQSNIPNISGSPEGVVYAPIGYLLTDDIGRAWIKKTPGEVATGWCQLICLVDIPQIG